MTEPSRNARAQKVTERRHLDRFLELAGFEAQVDHRDRPDFLLNVAGRAVGLEHQELTDEDLARTSDNLTQFEVELAKELERAGADKDLHVAVSVNAASPAFLRRRELPDMARRIATFAVERSDEVTREHRLRVFARDLRPLGILGPDFIFIERTSGELEGTLLTVSRGVLGAGNAALLEAVRSKEMLLPAYAANTGTLEQWLLLVTGERYEQSTDSALAKWARVETAFARVYLMDLRTGELLRADSSAGPPG